MAEYMAEYTSHCSNQIDCLERAPLPRRLCTIYTAAFVDIPVNLAGSQSGNIVMAVLIATPLSMAAFVFSVSRLNHRTWESTVRRYVQDNGAMPQFEHFGWKPDMPSDKLRGEPADLEHMVKCETEL